MAGVGCALTPSSVVALTGGVAKTVQQLVSPANQACMMKKIHTTYDGTSSTATPGLNALYLQTSAGTASALSPVKYPRSDESETLQSTGQTNFTVEPSYGNLVWRYHVHPQLGFVYEWAYGDLFKCVGGGRIGLVLNYAAAVNAQPTFHYEE
jgi:hypothetical protein